MQSINLEKMLSGLFFLSLILILTFFAHFSLAQEEGEAAPAAAETQRPENSDFAEYNKHINKMSQLRGKIEEGEKKIQQLILQKRMGQTVVKGEKGENQNVLDLIVQEHKSYLDNRDKFNHEYKQITYRFPSRGQEIRRQYRPLRPKTIQEVEKEMGLDGQLSDLKNKVQEKYQQFNPIVKKIEPEKERTPGTRQPASEQKEEERLRLKVE